MGDLGSRDVRSAGNVRAAREEDPIVAEDPFRPIVGKHADMFSSGEAQDR